MTGSTIELKCSEVVHFLAESGRSFETNCPWPCRQTIRSLRTPVPSAHSEPGSRLPCSWVKTENDRTTPWPNVTVWLSSDRKPVLLLVNSGRHRIDLGIRGPLDRLYSSREEYTSITNAAWSRFINGTIGVEKAWPDPKRPGTQISDAGLVHLKGLSSLQWLGLENTQITGAGLVHPEALSNLSTLNLDDTQITDAGVAKLKEALPNCEISR